MRDGLGHPVKIDQSVDLGHATREAGPSFLVEAGRQWRRAGRRRLGRHRRHDRRRSFRRLRRSDGFDGRRFLFRRSVDERACGLADEVPKLAIGGRERPVATPAHAGDPSSGIRTTKRPDDCIAPATAPASSPEPKKMSPRAGPTMARAGVLGDQQAAERRAAARERGLDPDRRMEAVDQAVDGEAATGGERHLRGGNRSERRVRRPVPRERR